MAAALASVKQNNENKGTPNLGSLNKIISTGDKFSQELDQNDLMIFKANSVNQKYMTEIFNGQKYSPSKHDPGTAHITSPSKRSYLKSSGTSLNQKVMSKQRGLLTTKKGE